MLGFPLLYFKGMRLLMFQLSGFYYSWVLKSIGSQGRDFPLVAPATKQQEH